VSEGTSGYEIPSDNPFVNNPAVLDEIWSLGWRNPFRWSFDSETGDLWVGEVGWNTVEEIDFEPAGTGGRNYEWAIVEADEPGPNTGDAFGPGTRTEPEIAYTHADGGCSVTGGVVYRGPQVDLRGVYFYADYCQNKVWTYEREDPAPDEVTDEFGDATDRIVAFGEDGFGALLVVLIGGEIYRVGPTGDQCSNGEDDDGDGKTDDMDPGCSDPDDPSERNPSTACDDGVDNDGDGDIDTADGNCSGPDDPQESPSGIECSNFEDDDGDGAADYPDDPGCANANDESELDPNIQCDDGLDNDDDGDVDYPDDANCKDSEDINESPASGNGSGGGCGLGFELALLVPLLRWARRRRAA
jgi:hypothetical protein